MTDAASHFVLPLVLAVLTSLALLSATSGGERCGRSIDAELCCMRSRIFSGCCTDDYCPKPAPCVAALCIRSVPDDYCPKPQPCIRCVNVGRCPDNYCPKPFPVICDPCQRPVGPAGPRTGH